MSDQPIQLDVNTATREELMTLSGIGLALAERIITARPFESIDELSRVSGIGSNLIEQLNGQLMVMTTETDLPNIPAVVETSEENATPAEVDQLETGTDETPIMLEEPMPLLADDETASIQEQELEPAREDGEELGAVPEPDTALEALPPPELPEPEIEPPPVARSQPPVTEKPQPKSVTRSGAIWMAIASGVLAFVLAIAATLGILLMFNGGLSYVNPSQLSDLSRKVDGVSAQASILEQDIEGLRARMQNLEGLAGRVSEIEKGSAQIRKDIDTTSTQVKDLDQQVGAMTEQVQKLQQSTARFQGFLDGLFNLLEGLPAP